MCESNTIFMSLLRSKNVCSLLLSFCVPVFEPLRFVDVIVILLAELGCESLICVMRGGHVYREHHQVAGKQIRGEEGWDEGYGLVFIAFCCISLVGICFHSWDRRWRAS